MKSYNELEAHTSKQARELAEIRKELDAQKAAKIQEEQRRVEQDRLSKMTDEEKELVALQDRIVKPVLDAQLRPLQQELEETKKVLAQKETVEFEKNRVSQNQGIFNAYVNTVNPDAKVVADELWEISELPGFPSPQTQAKLPAEHQGKPYRLIPYDALFNAYYSKLLQAGKDEAFRKVEVKAKTQPIGTKSSGAAKEPDYSNMTTAQLEKLIPSNL